MDQSAPSLVAQRIVIRNQTFDCFLQISDLNPDVGTAIVTRRGKFYDIVSDRWFYCIVRLLAPESNLEPHQYAVERDRMDIEVSVHHTMCILYPMLNVHMQRMFALPLAFISLERDDGTLQRGVVLEYIANPITSSSLPRTLREEIDQFMNPTNTLGTTERARKMYVKTLLVQLAVALITLHNGGIFLNHLDPNRIWVRKRSEARREYQFYTPHHNTAEPAFKISIFSATYPVIGVYDMVATASLASDQSKERLRGCSCCTDVGICPDNTRAEHDTYAFIQLMTEVDDAARDKFLQLDSLKQRDVQVPTLCFPQYHNGSNEYSMAMDQPQPCARCLPRNEHMSTLFEMLRVLSEDFPASSEPADVVPVMVQMPTFPPRGAADPEYCA
jgi:hypothetical protein